MLPRLYPRMLTIAYEHQDAGPAGVHLHGGVAGDGRADGDRADASTARSARSPRRVDGDYTGRPGGPFTYREGKAEAIRELAEREGIDLAASWAYSDSESDLPMLRAVGHPVAVNPDAALARVAREEGWEILRFDRLGRRLRVAVAAVALGGIGSRGAPADARMSLHELTPEQQEIRALARRFADERIAPRAAEWDRDHVFPRELFGELGELGLMGVCVPEEQGGAGADFLSYVLVLEELSRADAGVGVTVAVHTSACTLPLLAHGSPYVHALAAGEEIGAFALTESGSGSDASRAAHARAATTASPAPSSGARTARTPRRSSSSRARRTAGSAPTSCAPAPTALRSRARRRRWG